MINNLSQIFVYYFYFFLFTEPLSIIFLPPNIQQKINNICCFIGPEEDKLLGSILLPSYKVSVCGSEAKFNKKYAFKLEHANMRTYILAADSQELMAQWILNLNAACLLQSHRYE